MLGFTNIIFTTFCSYFTEATRSDFKDHTKNVREALQKAEKMAYKDAARTKKKINKND